MSYTFAYISRRIYELRNIVIDYAMKLIDKIHNLPSILRSEFDKKYFDLIMTNTVKAKLIEKMQTYKFDTSGFLGTYAGSVKITMNVDDNLNCNISYSDKKFKRNHRVVTEYVNSNGVYVRKSILSGKIIDMVDSGRSNFKIHAKHGKIVNFHGKKFRWVVYRALNKKGDVYTKFNNKNIYSPKIKDQYRVLVPDQTSITVNGSKYSTFGIGIYDIIKETAYDNALHTTILGMGVDEFVDSVIEKETGDLLRRFKESFYELVKFKKMDNVERIRKK